MTLSLVVDWPWVAEVIAWYAGACIAAVVICMAWIAHGDRVERDRRRRARDRDVLAEALRGPSRNGGRW